MRGVVGAELVRCRRSSAVWFPLVGLALGVFNCAGWVVSPLAEPSWRTLAAWFISYATVLSAVAAALVSAAIVRREDRARTGGTAWRAVTPGAVTLVQLIVVAVVLLATDLLVVAPELPFGLAGGLADPPVGILLRDAVACWVANLAVATLAFALARRLGGLTTVALSVPWQVAGTLTAESPRWWAMPWTWGVRPMLPLLGTHSNGVALTAGEPLLDADPLPALGLSVALCLVIGAWTCLRARPMSAPWTLPIRRGVMRVPGGSVRRARLRAIVGMCSLGSFVLLAGVLVLGLAAFTVVYGRHDVWQLHGLLVLPVLAVSGVVLAWSKARAGWRVASIRTGPAALASLVAVAVIGVGLAVDVMAFVLGSGEWPVRHAVLMLLMTILSTVLALAGAVSWGVLPVCAAALVVLPFTLIFGATPLADGSLWVLSVQGWASSAAQPGRFPVAVVAALVGIPAGGAWLAAAARRAAARGA